MAAGNVAEAQRDYEKLRELQPAVAEVHANLGLVYFEERKYEEAIKELSQALKLKPGLPKLHSLLAMSLSELGRYSEAVGELESCFAHSPDPPAKRMCGLQLERTYTGLQRDADAVQVALQLQRLYPNDAEILYHNEKIYGNYAFQTIQHLSQGAPESLWKHQAAAEAFESQGAYDSALAEYRAVLALDAQRPRIHYRMGRTLLARFRNGHSTADAAEARKEFEMELQVDPSNANAAYELAEIHRESQQLDEAAQMFELALRAYPDFEEAHVGLAAVLMAQQKPEEAIAHLRKAVALRAKDDVAWYRLSLAARQLGDVTEQKRAMDEFQRLHSASRPGGEEETSTELTRQTLDK